MDFSKRAKGFTLVELLVVVAIITILTAITLVTLNPAEILKKSRDARRLEEVSTLKKAIDIYISQVGVVSLGPVNTLYASAAVNNATTGSGDNGSGHASLLARVDGSGWLPLNLASIPNLGSPVSSLPLDPTGDYSASAVYYYRYMTDGTNWEVNAKLESASNAKVMKDDGGNSDLWYEVGSKTDILGD